jgi:hypothetical protein
MLADQTDYATVSRTLELGVGVAGVLGWADSSLRGGRLAVKEQEEVELNCESLGSYPPSTILIQGSDSLTRGREVRNNGFYCFSERSQTKFFFSRKLVVRQP